MPGPGGDAGGGSGAGAAGEGDGAGAGDDANGLGFDGGEFDEPVQATKATSAAVGIKYLDRAVPRELNIVVIPPRL
jgi:hypothetical protein